MATKKVTHKSITPNQRFMPLARMLGPWVREVARRENVYLVITDDDFGAPAAFDLRTGELLLHSKYVQHINPSTLANATEFLARYPKIAGMLIHEIMHARFSPDTKLSAEFLDALGPGAYQVAMTLEESRCERKGFNELNKWEQQALRTCLLYVVLQDLHNLDEEEEQDKLAANILSTVSLVGLISGRIDAQILDIEHPVVYELYVGMVTALGDYFSLFNGMAIEYSNLETGWWTSDVPRMKEIARDWYIALQAMIDEARKEEEERKRQEEGEEGEEGEGESQGEQPGEEQEQEGQGPSSKSDDDGEQGGELEESEVQVQEEGDGSKDLDANPKGEGAGFGEYGSGYKSNFDKISDFAERLEEMVEEAAEQEVRVVQQVMLAEISRELHKSTMEFKQERKRNNAEAKAKWQALRTKGRK